MSCAPPSSSSQSPSPNPRAPAPGIVEEPTPPIDSERLFAGRAEIRIAHGDAVYRLRRTALGKLILTK